MHWTCQCGAFQADVSVKGGTRAVCYCASCRDFVTNLGHAAALDAAGGNDLYQVAPKDMTVLKGGGHLALTQQSANGPFRWYVTCCNTPLANTLSTPKWPFLTLQSAWFEEAEALGPVACRVHRKDALQRVPDDAGGARRLYWAFAVRALRARLSGAWRRNPFFATDGTPVADPAPIRR